MILIYTIYVHNYSIKYSYHDSKIHISMPNFLTVLDDSTTCFNDEMLEKLIKLGWSETAIEDLNKIILIDRTERKGIIRINPITGISHE